MARRTGSVKKHLGVWKARVTFEDSSGKRRETRVEVPNRAAGQDVCRQIIAELHELGPDEYLRRKKARRHPLAADPKPQAPVASAIDTPTVPTIGRLADHYREHYACPPKFRNGHKYAGLQSFRRVREHVATIEAHFGRDLPLAELTFDRVSEFRVTRLDTPVQLRGWRKANDRSFANVHRCLSILRRMLVIAGRLGWVDPRANPFTTPATAAHEKLIAPSLENQRSRVLAPDEEKRLLKAYVHPVRSRTLPVIITLLETGARVGELVPVPGIGERRRLLWKDVDFAAGIVKFYGAKTEAGFRPIAMTPRLRDTLKRYAATLGAIDPEARVFALFTYSVVHDDFVEATEVAKVEDLRLHDLRHTRATRWIQGGLTESEVGYLLGHSPNSHVTRKYVNPDARTLQRSLVADASFKKQFTRVPRRHSASSSADVN